MGTRHPEDMIRDKDDLTRRLIKIEGQVRGIQRMIEQDRYCVDILTQVAAVRAALSRVGSSLLESHARGCMTAAARRGESDEAVAELMVVLDKFLK